LSSRGLSPGHRSEDYEIDLAAVVDKLALERFIIFASGGFGHTAVRYTVDHPDRMTALILNTTPIAVARYTQSMGALAAENWEYFLRLNLPPRLNTAEANEWLNRWLNPATYEDWKTMYPVSLTSNIEEQLPRLQAPTLVLHSKGFPIFGATESIKLAASIRNARLVMIDGNVMGADASEGLAAIDSFIADLSAEAKPRDGRGQSGLDGRLSMRENQVLKLIAEGKSNKEIASELTLSVRTVERHVGSIYAKIGVRGRVAAAAYARAKAG
jgi:DNA-binding CsgD family transcriptional regulator/pimeloyl-ACP methyl ester carboxylesterase